jgi:hypothetical protein|tara:strand:- start:325 stop:540 length:216 start_codon:yes stop_codon:yes gene_type:complete
MKRKEPDWSEEDIIKVRKIYRSGGTVDDAARAINSPLTVSAVRARAIKLGMRFISVPRSYAGTSKSSQPTS